MADILDGCLDALQDIPATPGRSASESQSAPATPTRCTTGSIAE